MMNSTTSFNLNQWILLNNSNTRFQMYYNKHIHLPPLTCLSKMTSSLLAYAIFCRINLNNTAVTQTDRLMIKYLLNLWMIYKRLMIMTYAASSVVSTSLNTHNLLILHPSFKWWIKAPQLNKSIIYLETA